MKYLSFSIPQFSSPHLGVLLEDNTIVDLTVKGLANNMLSFLQAGENSWAKTEQFINQTGPKYAIDEVRIHPPLLRPNSLRDFYAFEDHVLTANKNRNRKVPEQWYQVPVFYFSNPHAVYGHEEEIPIPKYTKALDFELEIAAIIGKSGRNITSGNAVDHIFGFTIFNDWSARDIQKQEMAVGLGPAKGKDFASSFGPYILTIDEIIDRSDGRPGVYDLSMKARINGEEVSSANWANLYYSFGQMIERASEEVTLWPGDIIGSGTVGTGCLLELTKGQGPWLSKGDTIELEVERFGVLRNTII